MLPNRHIPLEESLLMKSLLLSEKLSSAVHIERLYKLAMQELKVETFQEFVYCLDILYALGKITCINNKVRLLK